MYIQSTEHRLYRAIHTPVRTPPIEPFSLKIPALRLAEIKVMAPGGLAQLQFQFQYGVVMIFLLCTITRPCSYSSVQLQMRKNLNLQGSLHSFAQSFPITSAPGDIPGTALPRIPRILSPQTSDRPFGEEVDYYEVRIPYILQYC